MLADEVEDIFDRLSVHVAFDATVVASIREAVGTTEITNGREVYIDRKVCSITEM